MKRGIFDLLRSQSCDVHVLVDMRNPRVDLPEEVPLLPDDMVKITLFDHVKDLLDDEDGVSAMLNFSSIGADWHDCHIPWDAVLVLATEDVIIRFKRLSEVQEEPEEPEGESDDRPAVEYGIFKVINGGKS